MEEKSAEGARWTALLMSKPLYLTVEEACNHDELFAEMELSEMELYILFRTSSKTWSWEE